MGKRLKLAGPRRLSGLRQDVGRDLVSQGRHDARGRADEGDAQLLAASELDFATKSQGFSLVSGRFGPFRVRKSCF